MNHLRPPQRPRGLLASERISILPVLPAQHGLLLRLGALPMALPPYINEKPDGVILAVKLQPRASRNEIADALGNELRIKVTAPPVDSAANEALVRFLAERLDCSRNDVELFRGQASRHKLVKIHGQSGSEVAERLRKG